MGEPQNADYRPCDGGFMALCQAPARHQGFYATAAGRVEVWECDDHRRGPESVYTVQTPQGGDYMPYCTCMTLFLGMPWIPCPVHVTAEVFA